MPLDAEITVTSAGRPPMCNELLLDYAPVHRFLWYLRGEDLGRPETLDRFESLVRQVDLEFPLGYRMPGCYLAAELHGDVDFRQIQVVDAPLQSEPGGIAVAAILLDKEQVGPGDRVNLAAIFHDTRNPEGTKGVRLLVEGRAYDPARPSGSSPLKTFGRIEREWATAVDLGRGYRMITVPMVVPDWARPRPVGEIEVDGRAIGGGREGGHIGLRIRWARCGAGLPWRAPGPPCPSPGPITITVWDRCGSAARRDGGPATVRLSTASPPPGDR